jgi:hypothetical protein
VAPLLFGMPRRYRHQRKITPVRDRELKAKRLIWRKPRIREIGVVCDFEFGHAVYEAREGRRSVCRYVDTGEAVVKDGATLWRSRGRGTRPCAKCGEFPTKDGHDPCIESLPGAQYACCGHGVREAYVSFGDGLIIRGQFDHLDGEWSQALGDRVESLLMQIEIVTRTIERVVSGSNPLRIRRA